MLDQLDIKLEALLKKTRSWCDNRFQTYQLWGRSIPPVISSFTCIKYEFKEKDCSETTESQTYSEIDSNPSSIYFHTPIYGEAQSRAVGAAKGGVKIDARKASVNTKGRIGSGDIGATGDGTVKNKNAEGELVMNSDKLKAAYAGAGETAPEHVRMRYLIRALE